MNKIEKKFDNPSFEGYMPFGNLKTFYRVFGEIGQGEAPLIVVHGGPGMTHNYLLDYAALAKGGRAVVFYDQIGNGRSSRLDAKIKDTFSVGFMTAELENLVAGLDVTDRHVILGQSAGGIVALEYAIRRPNGLAALILANAYASTSLIKQSVWQWRRQLPLDAQEIMSSVEAGKTAESDKRYQEVFALFMSRYFCRVEVPAHVTASFAALSNRPEVFNLLVGSGVFAWDGRLAGWSALDRLSNIKAPTLAFRGYWDEANATCLEAFENNIENITTHTFGRSSHLPHVEDTSDCLSLVSSFLEKNKFTMLFT